MTSPAAPAAVARPALLAEALDFAPDLLAIQERPPARLPRALGLTVVALVGLLLVWAWWARLDIIATAEGRLVPVTYTKVVQPADAGVVTEILVKDGDAVKAGQVLLRLDPRSAQADSTAIEQELAQRRLVLRRIEAELADRPFVLQRGDPAALAAQVEAQFRARRQAYLDNLAQENETLNKARADLQAAEQVLAKLAQTLPVYRQSAEAYRRLHAEGFVGELAAAEKSREALEKDQDHKSQTATVQSLRASIALSEKRLAGLRSQYRSQLENERLDTVAQLNRSDQEQRKAAVRSGNLEVRAPTDGVVKDLATTTRGAVVAAGALLMNIVPLDEALQAEVQLKNEDIGFVATGQVARIKVATYPFQKYGLIEGQVILVGADSTDPRQVPSGAGGGTAAVGSVPAYRALVRLPGRSLVSAADGAQLPLNPGMLVTAEIHQGTRSVLEYLLSPVRKVGQEAARER